MFIYTENDTIVNTAVVAFFDVDEGCDSVRIFANFVDGTPVKISEHETATEAQEMLGKIYLCLDSNRSLDMRETEGDK